MATHPVLINGAWISSNAPQTFQATAPASGAPLDDVFPVSSWDEVSAALDAAAAAAHAVQGWSGERFAEFLEAYATAIEEIADDLVETAHRETALPVSPRLKDVELPRTTSQLRQAAQAAGSGNWCQPTIDTQTGIRACFGPLGPVAVFGPNNFPFAFNSIAGGDFAAAVAAGNPVIAKGHSAHPATTRLFAEAADRAAKATEMPPGFVQLIYRTSHTDGERLVSDPRLGGTGYTGSRSAGLKLKQAADAAGIPIYLELSSINPVFVLPGALQERAAEIADEFTTSCLMGTGQFCTNPGLVVLLAGSDTEQFISDLQARFEGAAAGVLLGPGVLNSLSSGVDLLTKAGATVLTGGRPVEDTACCYQNTLLRVDGGRFLQNPEGLQAEAFGNCSLLVVADNAEQLQQITNHLEGNLTGCVYSHTGGDDDGLYDQFVPMLRQRVGRLLNDKMPTGVAVSAAMNHGGPYPATGHPGFTAVGMPTAIHRFGMWQCFDNVRPHRLPAVLRDEHPGNGLWRLIDGQWTQANVGG